VRNVALLRGGLRGKARDFNWHNVVGLWSAIPLFVVVLSGVVISYPWQHRASLTVDRATGRELRWEPFAGQTPGRRLRAVLRFAHTGEVLGLAGQTVAGLVSLGATLLVWTGLALSARRLLAWRGRRQRRAAAGPVGAERAERAA
jgi:uncharacterized iron-regulated membrane protein